MLCAQVYNGEQTQWMCKAEITACEWLQYNIPNLASSEVFASVIIPKKVNLASMQWSNASREHCQTEASLTSAERLPSASRDTGLYLQKRFHF